MTKYITDFCSIPGKMANRRLSVVKDSSLAATFGNINIMYGVVECRRSYEGWGHG